jgi:hypothetical protein
LIIEILMDMLKALILFVLDLLPELPDMPFVDKYIDSFVWAIRSVNQFVSVPVVGFCFLAILACYNVRAIWSIIMWVIRKIPGVS